MNERFSGQFLMLLALLMTCGCAGSGQSRLPAARGEAIRHNDRGVAAEERKDYRRAEIEFSQALRLQSSIENYPGMVTALINMARLGRQSGDAASAHSAVARALTLVAAVPELASEVYFEQAKLLLHDGKTTDAAISAELAIAAAAKKDKPRMKNLLAEISNSEGALQATRAHAEEGLRLARETGNSREEANGLRLLGEAALAEGRTAEAAERFDQALAIDKELGFSGKIGVDLRGLARAAEAAGDRKGALGYRQRAVELAIAAGDRKGAAADLAALAKLYDLLGEREKAMASRQQSEELTRPR